MGPISKVGVIANLHIFRGKVLVTPFRKLGVIGISHIFIGKI